MEYQERNRQFKEKLTQVAALMEEMKVLANYRYQDSVHDDLFMYCNFGSNGDVYGHMKEACKHYGIKLNSSDVVHQA